MKELTTNISPWRTTRKRISQPILSLLIASLLSGCGSRPGTTGHNEQTASGYIAITEDDCEKTGINGRWELVNIRNAGKNAKPTSGQTVDISDCSRAAYSSGNSPDHSDTFKLFRVVQYCADFQLVYRNDSISCINFRKDTLIIGACNDYEDTRFYYRRLQVKM